MRLNFQSFKKLPVETESGIFLGYIKDIEWNSDSLIVDKFIVKDRRIWQKGELILSPAQIIQITETKIIVSNNMKKAPIENSARLVKNNTVASPAISTHIDQ